MESGKQQEKPGREELGEDRQFQVRLISAKVEEVLKKTVKAEQLKLLAEGDPTIQRPLQCPKSIKFLEMFTRPVESSAVERCESSGGELA